MRMNFRDIEKLMGRFEAHYLRMALQLSPPRVGHGEYLVDQSLSVSEGPPCPTHSDCPALTHRCAAHWRAGAHSAGVLHCGNTVHRIPSRTSSPGNLI